MHILVKDIKVQLDAVNYSEYISFIEITPVGMKFNVNKKLKIHKRETNNVSAFRCLCSFFINSILNQFTCYLKFIF